MPNESTATEAVLELDARVGELVMGLRRPLPGEYTWDGHEWFAADGGKGVRLPEYSTDIAAAWTVINTMMSQRGAFGFSLFGSHETAAHCTFTTADGDAFGAEGESIPHAICLAALSAVESSHV